MKVKELRERLEDVPDNLEIVTPSTDHSYRRVFMAKQATGAYNTKYREYFEYAGEEYLDEYEEPKEIFLIN